MYKLKLKFLDFQKRSRFLILSGSFYKTSKWQAGLTNICGWRKELASKSYMKAYKNEHAECLILYALKINL